MCHLDTITDKKNREYETIVQNVRKGKVALLTGICHMLHWEFSNLIIGYHHVSLSVHKQIGLNNFH